MVFKFIVIAACASAIYFAFKGTTSTSAKIAMVGLISCPIILVLL